MFNKSNNAPVFKVVAIYILCTSFVFCKQSNLINKDELTLLVIISPTCPICQYYVADINKIQDSLNIPVLAILPKNCMANKSELTEFENNFAPKFKIIKDNKNHLLKKYKPEITPEFFLIRNDSILYQGAFNDKFLDIGNKKSVVQKYYLSDAINGINNNLFYDKKTKAVGCIIPLK